MATATLANNAFSGGSNSDRVTPKDLATIVDGPFEGITDGAYAYRDKVGGSIFNFASSGFFDLTNLELHLNRNGSTASKIQLSGDVVVGREGRENTDVCRIHFANRLRSNTLIHSGAKVVCNVPIEFIQRADTSGGEPGVGQQDLIANNNPDSKLKVHYVGSSLTRGTEYTLPRPNGFKPNGTTILKWEVTAAVLEREFVYRCGYIDWRPQGNWAAPTAGGFYSETWMKWLGSANAYSATTPLVFGNKDNSFGIEIGLAGHGGAYFLCGWHSFSGQLRNVFNNLSGLNIRDQVAFYQNVQLENHVQWRDNFIDAQGNFLLGVEAIVYHTPPAIEANTILVLQSEQQIRAMTLGSSIDFGDGSGKVSKNVCIEAMRKYGGGADTDGAYSSINAAGVSYVSSPTIYTTYKKWGKVVQERVPRTFVLCGNVGDGKPKSATIKFNDDTVLVATDITRVDDGNLYDLCYKWAYQNDIANIAAKDGDFVDLGAYDIEFKDIANKGSNDVFDVTGNQITYYVTPQLDANIRTTGLATGKEFVNGSITDVEGTTTLVNFTSGFSDSAVLVYDKAANETISYETGKTAPYPLLLGAEHNGKELTYVVSRAGYTTVIGEFTAGGVVNISTSQSLRKTSSGQALYQSLTNSNISIVFDLTAGAEICFIDIGNASVKAQEVVDVLEVALESEDGGKFLAITNGSSCTVETLAGQTYILLGTQYRFRRKTAADVNSAVQAFGISADGIPQDGVNGAVQFLTASTLTEESIAQAVWNYMQSEPTVSDSMREQLDKLTSQVEVNAG